MAALRAVVAGTVWLQSLVGFGAYLPQAEAAEPLTASKPPPTLLLTVDHPTPTVGEVATFTITVAGLKNHQLEQLGLRATFPNAATELLRLARLTSAIVTIATPPLTAPGDRTLTAQLFKRKDLKQLAELERQRARLLERLAQCRQGLDKDDQEHGDLCARLKRQLQRIEQRIATLLKEAALATASLTITVRPANHAPVLAPIGAQTVAEGALLVVAVTATDADGDPLTFHAAPLPPGALFTEHTLRWSPTFDQAGTYAVTVTVSDGVAQDAETFTITVTPTTPPPPTERSAYLHGHVFHALTGTPLPEARVTVRGLQGTVLTDAAGRFVFPTPAGGTFLLTIDKEGFTFAQRTATVEDTRDVAVEPIRLTPLDAAVTMIGPDGGSHTNSAGTVEVTIPAGAVEAPIAVRATPYQAGAHLPGPLPELSHFTYALDLQPDDTRFAVPVTFRIRNTLGFAPGTPIPIGFYNRATAAWEPAGMGVVLPDGAFAEFQITHFSPYDCNLPVLPPAGADSPATLLPMTPPVRNMRLQCALPGSRLGIKEGALGLDVALPTVQRLGQPRGVTLTYDSRTAFPTVSLGSEHLATQLQAKTPASATWEVEFQGRREQATFAGDRGAFAQRLVLTATNGRGDLLPTGRYRYHLQLANNYPATYATAEVFGGPPVTALGVPAPELKSFTSPLAGDLVVRNERDAPWGAGWMLQGLERLHPQPDGTILLADGSGSALPFTPALRAAGLLENGTQDPESPWLFSFANAGLGVQGLAVDSQNRLYVVVNNFSIYRGLSNGTVELFAGGLSNARHIASDSHDNLYVTEQAGGNEVITKIAQDGTRTTFFSQTAGTAEFRGLVMDQDDHLYVASQQAPVKRILKFDPEGHVTTVADIAGPGQLNGLALDAAGRLYAALVLRGSFLDAETNEIVTLHASRILQITPAGGVATYAVGFEEPRGLTVDADGNLYVVDAGKNALFKVRPDRVVEEIVRGDSTEIVPGVGVSQGLFDPRALVMDRLGRLFVSHRFMLRAFGRAGGVTDFAGTVSLLVNNHQFFPPPGTFDALVKHADGTFTNTTKDGLRSDFDMAGQLTTVTDRNGNLMRYAYDPEGRLTTITEPTGETTTFTYNAATGRLARITDPVGRSTDLTQDADGNLVRVTFPDGGMREFAYDANHLLLRSTDERLFTTDYTYDALGFLTAEILPERTVLEGGVPVLRREVRTLAAQDRTGLVNDLPDGVGTPSNPAPPVPTSEVTARFTDAQGHTSRFQLDPLGQPTTTVDPLGRTTMMERGPLGWTTIPRANRDGLPTAILQPSGLFTQLDYDDRGNVTTVSQFTGGPGGGPGFGTTRFTYEPFFSQVTAMTDPLGTSTTMEYDANGHPIRITELANFSTPQRTTFTYDPRGLLTSTTDHLNDITNFTYDPVTGNLLTTTDPLGNATTLTYDSAGNVATSTDALGRMTRFTYDSVNHLTEVADAAGGATRYTYDAAGNLTSVTDARGNATNFTYDPVHLLERATNPVGETKTFGYDLTRHLAQVTDAAGQVLTFTYDAADQLITKTLPDNVVTFTYDAGGRMASVADSDSHLAFTYDAAGHLLSTTTNPDANPVFLQPTTTLTATYDLNGNRTSLVDPTGTTTAVYDAANRLTRLTDPLGHLTTVAYDALNRRTTLTHANGVVTSYSYDVASQLTSVRHVLGATTLATADYTYDPVGNRTHLTDLTGTHRFTYDLLNRLTRATHPLDPLEAFAYDPVGNRNPSTTTYDPANRLLDDGTFTYTYDANGNVTSKTELSTGAVTRYTYDAENRLTEVQVPTGEVLRYAYDGLGRKIQDDRNGTLTRFVYDGEDVLLEYDGTNTLRARYTHGPGIGEPLLRSRDSDGDGTLDETLTYLADGLGSVVALTDAAGAMIERYRYMSFGQPTITDAGGTPRSTSTLNNRLLFTARPYEPLTGLYDLRVRVLDPRIGRFLQEDRSEGDDIHPTQKYLYVSGDPVNYFDPNGQSAIAAGATIGATGGPAGAVIGVLIGIGVTIVTAILIDEALRNLRTCPVFHSGTKDFPANPDEWIPPPGVKEEPKAREATGGKHRHWKDPSGKIVRRWDRGEPGASGNKATDHWWDVSRPGEHIRPSE